MCIETHGIDFSRGSKSSKDPSSCLVRVSSDLFRPRLVSASLFATILASGRILWRCMKIWIGF